MSNFVLSCCSTVDLSAEHLKKRNIPYVPFHFTLNGVTYADDFGESFAIADFYRAMEEGAMPVTSQINVQEYIQYFEPFLAAGQDLLHIAFSSGLSGSCNSARIAQQELCERYPERKLYVVDSLAASAGYGLLIETLADMRDSGADIDTLHTWANAHKKEVHHWFFSTDLTAYVRGGRVSKFSGMAGTVLGICPLLNVDKDGHLIPRHKIRGKKKVREKMVEQMLAHAQNGQNYHGKCFLSHSACEEDARAVAEQVNTLFPHIDGGVQIFNIGTTIGSHTGTGTVALFFWGDERND